MFDVHLGGVAADAGARSGIVPELHLEQVGEERLLRAVLVGERFAADADGYRLVGGVAGGRHLGAKPGGFQVTNLDVAKLGDPGVEGF